MRVASRTLHFFCENCDISTILNSLYATVTKLQTEVDLLKANAKEVQVPHSFDSEELMQELEERHRRSTNLIVFNVEETTPRNLNADRDNVI